MPAECGALLPPCPLDRCQIVPFCGDSSDLDKVGIYLGVPVNGHSQGTGMMSSG